MTSRRSTPTLVENYADIEPFLKDRAWNSVDGQMYGVPHGWGANLLMYNTDVVKPAPTSWVAVFDDDSPYKGKVTAYDSPIYIADAALYLMKTKPELGIKNPYALDQKQLDAAVEVLKKQRQNVGGVLVGLHQGGQRVQQRRLGDRHHLAGDRNTPRPPRRPRSRRSCPTRARRAGRTPGWSRRRPRTPTAPTRGWTASPSPKPRPRWRSGSVRHRRTPRRATLTADKTSARPTTPPTRRTPEKIWYWTTPIAQCLDGRTDVQCTDYGDWTQAWTEIKG